MKTRKPTKKTTKRPAAKKAAAKRTAPKHTAKPKPETVLVLRTCDAQMRAYGGFVWPTSGPVEAPDWNPRAECGNGLHGLLWGEGDGSHLLFDPSARWLVVEVDASEIVDLKGKVKFRRGVVVHCGTRETATAYLAERRPGAIVGETETAGDYGTATAGDYGTATAGDYGTATAGYYGTATAGHRGTATAGHRGTATAGEGGTATAGEGGTVQIKWWDGRWRIAIGYVGEDGIEPNVAYCVVDGKLVPAKRGG